MRRFPIDLFQYGTELKIQLTCFLFFSWQRNGCILIDNELDVQIIVLCYLNTFHYSELQQSSIKIGLILLNPDLNKPN